ncbi:hypothetical protein [Bordetella genomosp. 9]|uniref:hypothetical protein n=1 Tax=Bordetella genomosp. 9 TaxID=1416803 RepID=UPI000A31EA18|nr:hypothetical protein [Bordetella genomosp. 9]
MRILFILIVLANIVVYGIGQGWLGTPPEDEGRDTMKMQQQLNADKVAVGRGS